MPCSLLWQRLICRSFLRFFKFFFYFIEFVFLQAELALKLGVRKPKTLPEIVKISGLEEKKCEELLEEMSRKGLLEYNWENAAHEKQYVLPMYVPGCAEFCCFL